MYVAKTKALISFADTAKLICVFVFAYAKCWFSHDAVQLNSTHMTFNSQIVPFLETTNVLPTLVKIKKIPKNVLSCCTFKIWELQIVNLVWFWFC